MEGANLSSVMSFSCEVYSTVRLSSLGCLSSFACVFHNLEAGDDVIRAKFVGLQRDTLHTPMKDRFLFKWSVP